MNILFVESFARRSRSLPDTVDAGQEKFFSGQLPTRLIFG